jgi:hypothetical protein
MTPIEHAEQDAHLYGIGFLVNGERVDPSHVSIVGRSIDKVQKALAQYYIAAEELRSYVVGMPPADVQRRLIEARKEVQRLLEQS